MASRVTKGCTNYKYNDGRYVFYFCALSYSSRTLHADPSELSRFLATRYVMFCLYSGPLI